jgi:D-3-phosphoglycerate dehydrogenase
MRYILGAARNAFVSDPVVEDLTVDLLEWLANGERTSEEVMSAWRTACPRLPVWEEANDRGFIAGEFVNGRNLIRLTPLGRATLDRRTAFGAAQLPPVERLE